MSNQNQISRRNIVRGAAWAVPVVAVASAVPAFATSHYHVWFESLGLACKSPGASCERETGITKGYVIRVRVCHDIPYTTTIIIGDALVSLSGGASTLWQVAAVQASANCTNTVVSTTPDPDAGEAPDVVLTMDAAPVGGQMCCVIDFGIEGQPSSQNVSISGTAPYSWTAPTTPGGGGIIALSAPSTPPCDHCEVVDVTP